jgi:hypothetical protein
MTIIQKWILQKVIDTGGAACSRALCNNCPLNRCNLSAEQRTIQARELLYPSLGKKILGIPGLIKRIQRTDLNDATKTKAIDWLNNWIAQLDASNQANLSNKRLGLGQLFSWSNTELGFSFWMGMNSKVVEIPDPVVTTPPIQSDDAVVCAVCGEIHKQYYLVGPNKTIVCPNCMPCVQYCRDCGNILTSINTNESVVPHICNECAENYDTCDYCGDMVPTESLEEVRVSDATQLWDPYCVSQHAQSCDHCHRLCSIDELNNIDGDHICNDCSDDYVRCEECATLMSPDSAYCNFDEENDAYYCDACYQAARQVIHSYSYTPDPLLFHISSTDIEENPLYLGIELEVDSTGGKSEGESARHVEQAMGKDHIYIKSDGSLDNGYEQVTHPATLKYLLENRELYENMCKIPRKDGFSSHDIGSCGLHVHIDRRFLGNTTTARNSNIAKILYLNEKFWPAMVKFSRRDRNSIEHWAKRYLESDQGYSIDTETPDSVLDKARGADRYRAVNLQRSPTVEFRLWRGTLNTETFWATLQLTDNFVRLAKATAIDDLQKLNFADIARFCEYPELNEYLGKRFPDFKELMSKRSLIQEINDGGEVSAPQVTTVPLMNSEGEEGIIRVASICSCQHRNVINWLSRNLEVCLNAGHVFVGVSPTQVAPGMSAYINVDLKLVVIGEEPQHIFGISMTLYTKITRLLGIEFLEPRETDEVEDIVLGNLNF